MTAFQRLHDRRSPSYQLMLDAIVLVFPELVDERDLTKFCSRCRYEHYEHRIADFPKLPTPFRPDDIPF